MDRGTVAEILALMSGTAAAASDWLELLLVMEEVRRADGALFLCLGCVCVCRSRQLPDADSLSFRQTPHGLCNWMLAPGTSGVLNGMRRCVRCM